MSLADSVRKVIRQKCNPPDQTKGIIEDMTTRKVENVLVGGARMGFEQVLDQNLMDRLVENRFCIYTFRFINANVEKLESEIVSFWKGHGFDCVFKIVETLPFKRYIEGRDIELAQTTCSVTIKLPKN